MRIKLLLVTLLTALSLYSRTIAGDEALQIAKTFLGKDLNEASQPDNMKRANSRSSNSSNIHIFNATDGNGFVVVSGDDRITPILAYSDKGSFEYDNAPEAALWLLSIYEQTVNNIEATSGLSRSTNNSTKSGDTGYLLKTQWNQGSPFNEECPLINGTRAMTGCVATAMAQVINYENKSRVVKSIPGYFLNEGYNDLPEREFNFGNLVDSEIAHLMRYCGQAVEMDYGVTESGAQFDRVPGALHKYFGWEPDIHIINRGDYNDVHWNRMISEEIASGHPIIYSAMSESGLGHAFVVDGVSNDYFHVNWGWGGLADGYYSFLSFGSDNKSEYILNQEIVTFRDDDPSNDVITHGTTIDGINYQLSDDLTAAVLPLKNGEKYRGELVIPSTVEYEGKKYTVNYFGQSAFVNCRHLTSISIPATITGQEWSCFENCENLHKVNVEDLISFINLEVGAWWTGSPLWNGADLYLKGELVKDLVIPEGIETVGYSKFAHCTSIESVTFPSTMKLARTYSFSDCPNLKIINALGSSLETIESYAFINASALEELYLPETLQTISGKAFGKVNGPGFPKLKKLVCKAINPPYTEGNDPAFCLAIYNNATVYVPDSQVDIYRNAKEWCDFIDIAPLSEEEPLPQTMEIQYGDLNYELNLDKGYAKVLGLIDPEKHWGEEILVIPHSVTYDGKDYSIEEIGLEAFYGRVLQGIEIQAPIRKIGIRSFCGCRLNRELILPSTLKRIPYQAFMSPRHIPKIVFGENLDCIGKEAFYSENYGSFREPSVLEFEFKGIVPPTVYENSFEDLEYSMSKLIVPYGAKKNYASDPIFSKFKNIINSGDLQEEPLDYDLTLIGGVEGKSALCDGMPIKIRGKIFNMGKKPVTNIDLGFSIDGKLIETKNIKVEIRPNDTYILNIDYPVDTKSLGNHELSLIVLPGNNVDDQDKKDNELSIPFSIIDGFYRVSLIEQFTSEQCGLTPRYNGKIFDAIKETENEDFVAHVFNHCGFYDDFLTLNHDYEWFYNDWGTYTPAVMLNRTDINKTGYTPVMNVTDQFALDLKDASDICSARVSVFTEIDEKLCVKVILDKDSTFNPNNGYDFVTVYIIEDSIPAREQSGAEPGYYHRNVLRKVVSMPWGEIIKWDGDRCLYKFETKLNPEWNTRNLSAIAFMHRYDPTSPTDCQVYTAGASYLPQYIELPDDTSKWMTWNSDVVRELSLNNTMMDLTIGNEARITASFSPENYLSNLVWNSNDENVVSVEDVDMFSSTATVKAMNEGSTTITVKIPGTEIEAHCDILVWNVSSIDAINVDSDENIKVYNTTGLLVFEGKYSDAKLNSGIYIIVTTDKTYKLFVK